MVRGRGTQFHTLQNHLVATDDACTKVAAGATEQAIRCNFRFAVALTAVHNHVSCIDHQFCVLCDGAGRGDWIAMAQKFRLHAGKRPHFYDYFGDLHTAALARDLFYLIEKRDTDR